MNFSDALNSVKAGASISRDGWNRKGMWVKAQFPDENSKMTKPYLYIEPCETDRLPWYPSTADLFATDWLATPLETGGNDTQG